jgi:glycerophosphoryl diester phosphodiesterase
MRRLTRWQKVVLAFALLLTGFSLFNASWLAPTPRGKLILVAHRGIAQQYDHRGLKRDDCTATRIAVPEHNYIENTIRSMIDAASLGADMIELDVHPTKDGHMVVFHDWTLDCRTNGKGPVREHMLAELKGLDLGYGYTADGGRTFPLRGRGVGMMPTVEEVLQALPAMPLLFNFKSRDPREADMLAAIFRRSGVPMDKRYAYYGDEAIIRRMRALAPGAWAWSRDSVRACTIGYAEWGWIGHVPKSCRNGTIVVPIDYQWAMWGWPNRFLARMAKAKAHVVVMGELGDGRSLVGLSDPTDLGRVPRDFRGYLWVEDIYTIGRALN